MSPSPTAPSPRQLAAPLLPPSPAPALSSLAPSTTTRLAHPHPSHARTHSLPHWAHQVDSPEWGHPTLSRSTPASAQPPSVARFASWPPVHHPPRGGPEPETLVAMYATLAARWGETARRIEDGRMCRAREAVGMKRGRSQVKAEGEGEEPAAKAIKVEVVEEARVQSKEQEDTDAGDCKVRRSTSPDVAPRRSSRQAIRHPRPSATRTPVSDCRGSRSSAAPPPAATTPAAAPLNTEDTTSDEPRKAGPATHRPDAAIAAPAFAVNGERIDATSASAPPLTPARSAALLAVVKSFEVVLGCRAESWRRMSSYQRPHQGDGVQRAQVAAWSA